MHGWNAFVALQSHYHMLERDVEREVLPYCQAASVGFVPYFPLAGGFLTGKYKRGEGSPSGSRGERSPYVRRYMTERNYDKVEQLTAWAAIREREMNLYIWRSAIHQNRIRRLRKNATVANRIRCLNHNAVLFLILAGKFKQGICR